MCLSKALSHCSVQRFCKQRNGISALLNPVLIMKIGNSFTKVSSLLCSLNESSICIAYNGFFTSK